MYIWMCVLLCVSVSFLLSLWFNQTSKQQNIYSYYFPVFVSGEQPTTFWIIKMNKFKEHQRMKFVAIEQESQYCMCARARNWVVVSVRKRQSWSYIIHTPVIAFLLHLTLIACAHGHHLSSFAAGKCHLRPPHDHVNMRVCDVCMFVCLTHKCEFVTICGTTIVVTVPTFDWHIITMPMPVQTKCIYIHLDKPTIRGRSS